jgi:hypothetical protein
MGTDWQWLQWLVPLVILAFLIDHRTKDIKDKLDELKARFRKFEMPSTGEYQEA